MNRSYRTTAPILALGILIVLLAAPILFSAGVFSPLCEVDTANAQDDTCLIQESTISAQEVQILRLQITSNAQEAELLQLGATDAALQSQAAEIVQLRTTNEFLESQVESGRGILVVTVMVVITTTPSPAPTQTDEPAKGELTPTPTPAALPPTAANSQVEIIDVISAGDVSSEGITIRNNGNTLDITGWQLQDLEGNTYTFPEQILFSNATVTVFTRAGDNTPIALYWGRIQPVFTGANDTLVLLNADSEIQAVYELE